jgi:hypothetical protein
LSYVLQDDAAVPPEGNDLAFGTMDSIYGSLCDKIAARAAHGTPQFQVDNAKVFELLNDAIGSHKHVKTWIKAFTKARNGQGAWIAFKLHYRGSNEVKAIEAAAEKALASLCCPTMLVPISTICAQENLRTSIDESIHFLCAFILANSNSDSRNVSSFAAEGSSKRKDNPNFKKKQGFNKKYKDSNTGQD